MYKTLDDFYSWLTIPVTSELLDLVLFIAKHEKLSKITEAQQRRLDAYLEVKPDGQVFDLTQDAHKRCRASTKILATLTKNCSLWWIQHCKRFFCTLFEYMALLNYSTK